jgi:hypothetical protein
VGTQKAGSVSRHGRPLLRSVARGMIPRLRRPSPGRPISSV